MDVQNVPLWFLCPQLVTAEVHCRIDTQPPSPSWVTQLVLGEVSVIAWHCAVLLFSSTFSPLFAWQDLLALMKLRQIQCGSFYDCRSRDASLQERHLFIWWWAVAAVRGLTEKTRHISAQMCKFKSACMCKKKTETDISRIHFNCIRPGPCSAYRISLTFLWILNNND